MYLPLTTHFMDEKFQFSVYFICFDFLVHDLGTEHCVIPGECTNYLQDLNSLTEQATLQQHNHESHLKTQNQNQHGLLQHNHVVTSNPTSSQNPQRQATHTPTTHQLSESPQTPRNTTDTPPTYSAAPPPFTRPAETP